MEPTIKVTLEGHPDQVERVTARLRAFFTVTYESKDQKSRLSPESIKRYLRVLPPGQAHQPGLPDTDQ